VKLSHDGVSVERVTATARQPLFNKSHLEAETTEPSKMRQLFFLLGPGAQRKRQNGKGSNRDVWHSWHGKMSAFRVP